MKLDLACGQHPTPGYQGVDLHAAEGVRRVNLLRFPWPWEDASVDEVRCSHFIEHIPSREVSRDDMLPSDVSFRFVDTYLGKDMLFVFMDEVHRILVPGGRATIVAPYARSNRAIQDPTHRRFIVEDTFRYFNKAWRGEAQVDHYGPRCDFDLDVIFLVDKSRIEESRKLGDPRLHWNIIDDVQCTMTKRMP